MSKNIIKRLLIGILLGLQTAALVILFTHILFPTVFNNFEFQTLDLRFTSKINKLEQARNGEKIEEIVIVDIDNRSLNKLGRFHQWPRDYYAEITNYLSKSNALAIGFDILFMERDLNRDADSLFVFATRNAQNVFHALSFSKAEPDAFLYKMDLPPQGLNYENYSFSFPPDIQNNFPAAERFDGKFLDLYNASRKLGFANYQPDEDSVIRKMPLFMNFAGRLYPSLPLAIIFYILNIMPDQISILSDELVQLKVISEQGTSYLNIPIKDQGQMLINYSGTYQSFRYVSFYDVLTQRVSEDFFTNKIVLIGASAPGLEDIRPVPFQQAFPGVEIHANIIYNILNQNFIYTKPTYINYLLVILLCLIIAIISSFNKMWISIPILMIIATGFIYSTFYSFTYNSLWVENVRPILGMVFSLVAVLGYKYFTEIKDKKRIKSMFQNYLSPSVVNELLHNPKMIDLGGERKIATSFFSDIKSFTSFSEKLQPEELVKYLNEYLSAMTDVILKYDGYLDKYEGDAIVAVFGIPVEQRDHALRACLAAVDMQNRLVKLRKRWKKQGKPLFETRIGINSGPMIAGNIGGTNRFDYTAIGDSVNLASRLEGANKIYGTSIMISEATFGAVSKHLWCRELDFIRVKGKTKPVRIYEIIDRKKNELGNVQKAYLEYYLKGLESYRKRELNTAQNYFLKALEIYPPDGPSIEFERRCKFFAENSLPENWDGVFEMTSK
jgi:adenylate cyclase